ncbi:MAG: hypothetical protein IJL87_03725 [Clostridia bacterium]|nr:hypothetical protein [Clostridia bacterium]
MKKIFALILILALIFSLASCGGSGKNDVKKDIAVGDKMTMGSFGGEKITWTAVCKGVGKVLLMSDKVIMRRVFNQEGDSFRATWKDSEIRAYLNGEFIDEAFSDKEKELLVPTSLRTVVFDADSYQLVNDYTEDRVFLLSAREAALYVMPIKDYNYGVPAKAALDDNIYMAEVTNSETVTEACGWALRDDGDTGSTNCKEIEGFDGMLSAYGNEKYYKQGIRPAMWVYTDKALARGWAEGTAAIPADSALDSKIAAMKVGDTVSFGTATLGGSNFGSTEVTWKVLDETDDAFLLYSEKLLGTHRFGESDDESVTWATSIVRAYINGDEFINDFFNPWERSKIRLSHISTCGSSPNWKVDPGPETDDYLFLLDREEIIKYFPNEADRIIAEDIPYWLRSPDFVPGWFNCINEAGTIKENEAYVNYGLRVAMWISK